MLQKDITARATISTGSDTSINPFYYKGYWYYFSYQDMAIYRSRFDGNEKKQLYQKMYHTNKQVYQPNYTKIHRIEFGNDKIYFLDYAEQYGIGLYTMPYDGGASSVQKVGDAPSPDQPLHPIEDVPEQEAAGMTVLRTEIMFSKMKDAYFHGAESYFTVQNTDRQRFRTQI